MNPRKKLSKKEIRQHYRAMRERVAASIIGWRHVRRLSQAQLARKAGVALSTLRNIEQMRGRSPTFKTMDKITKALDLMITLRMPPKEVVAGSNKEAA